MAGAEGARFGCDVDINGQIAVVGARQDSELGLNAGAAYVYYRDQGGGDNWAQVAKLVASDASVNQYFGISVAVDGNRIVVGAHRVGGSIGAAYVFERDEGGADNWGEVKKIVGSDTGEGYYFGSFVAIDGDVVAVGTGDADTNGENSGAVYVFERDNGGVGHWGEVKIVHPNDPAEDAFFGNDMALSGDTLLVGANLDLTQGQYAGAAYIFERDQGGTDNWGQVKKFYGSDTGAQDRFSYSLHIDGDTAVVGAFNHTSEGGAAYVYTRNEGGLGNWGEVAKLQRGDPDAGDQFGFSVHVHSDWIAVSSVADNDQGADSGAVYIFGRDKGGVDMWGQIAKVDGFLGQAGDRFGTGVAISGNYMFVGSQANAEIGSESGAAYVFKHDAAASVAWKQLRKLAPMAGAEGARFGYDVDIDGQIAVVGAREDSEQGSNAGAAYVFYRDQGGGENWAQVAKIFSSDAAANQYFGISVAVDGDRIVVGAHRVGASVGAAYVFERDEGGPDNWGQIKKLVGSDTTAGYYFGVRVDLDGDVVAVGTGDADANGENSGAAYLFYRDNGGVNNWGEVKIIHPDDPAVDAYFGNDLALSGNTLLVGANRDSTLGQNAGAAYVFERNQGGADNWGQVKKFFGSDTGAEDHFSYSVHIDGDTAGVGAFNRTSEGGAAYVFARNEGGTGNWGEVAKLQRSDPDTGDYFGFRVYLHADWIGVSSVGDNDQGADSGSVYIFERDKGGADTWGQISKVDGFLGQAGDRFGAGIALSGDYMIVGSEENSEIASSSGAAYVFGELVFNSAPVVENGAIASLPDLFEDEPGESNHGVAISDLLQQAAVYDAETPFEDIGAVVIASDNSNGNWEYDLDGAEEWEMLGSVSDSSALLLAPGSRIRFLPHQDFAGSVQNAIQLRAWDMDTGMAGDFVDLSDIGGSTPFSNNVLDVGITVLAINDPPDLGAPEYFSGNRGEIVAISGISVADVDATPSDLIFVGLSVDSGVLHVRGDVVGGLLPGEVSGDGTSDLILAGELDRILETLDVLGGVTYTSAAEFSGIDRLEVRANDNGATGGGGAQIGTATVPIVVNFPLIDSWRTVHFESDDLVDPSKESLIWGNEADPDFDWGDNVREYFLGTNPLDGTLDTSAYFVHQVEHDGEDYFALSIRERKDDTSVECVAEVSDDLEEWHDDWLMVHVVEDLGPEFDLVTYRDSIPWSQRSSLYARIDINVFDRPVVHLRAPQDGATFVSGDSVVLEAVASYISGDVSEVRFFANDLLLGFDASVPFEFVWDGPPTGSHLLTAEAVISGGGSSISPEVAISVETDVDDDGVPDSLDPDTGSPNSSPSISSIVISSSSNFHNEGPVEFAVQAVDPESDLLQFEFVVNGLPFSTWQVEPSALWQPTVHHIGLQNVEIGVKDQWGAGSTQMESVFLFMSPPRPE